jgi:membrane associated rhomboid family serine protease
MHARRLPAPELLRFVTLMTAPPRPPTDVAPPPWALGKAGTALSGGATTAAATIVAAVTALTNNLRSSLQGVGRSVIARVSNLFVVFILGWGSAAVDFPAGGCC